jgi:hypothetical protein
MKGSRVHAKVSRLVRGRRGNEPRTRYFAVSHTLALHVNDSCEKVKKYLARAKVWWLEAIPVERCA